MPLIPTTIAAFSSPTNIIPRTAILPTNLTINRNLPVLTGPSAPERGENSNNINSNLRERLTHHAVLNANLPPRAPQLLVPPPSNTVIADLQTTQISEVLNVLGEVPQPLSRPILADVPLSFMNVKEEQSEDTTDDETSTQIKFPQNILLTSADAHSSQPISAFSNTFEDFKLKHPVNNNSATKFLELTPSEKQDESGNINVGLLVGLIALALLILGGVGFFFHKRRVKWQKKRLSDVESPIQCKGSMISSKGIFHTSKNDLLSTIPNAYDPHTHQPTHLEHTTVQCFSSHDLIQHQAHLNLQDSVEFSESHETKGFFEYVFQSTVEFSGASSQEKNDGRSETGGSSRPMSDATVISWSGSSFGENEKRTVRPRPDTMESTMTSLSEYDPL